MNKFRTAQTMCTMGNMMHVIYFIFLTERVNTRNENIKMNKWDHGCILSSNANIILGILAIHSKSGIEYFPQIYKL